MSHDLVVRARRVVTTAGEVARCIGVTGGTVAAIEPLESELEGDRVVELGDDVVLLPGLVDTHVHVNEPGRSEWEGFATATRAAAAGGVTTILDMPLNSIPPTTDVAALEVKRKAAEPQAYVDVGFWGAPSQATSATCAACTTPASSASSASCSTPGWTSSRTSPRGSCWSTWRCCAPTTR
jgi:allantoinase